jgi:pimeloyl-ACP methyl ester carboxylesterase
MKSKKRELFRSAIAEKQFYAAYDAVLNHWPVPYQEIDIPTNFGTTHIIASGPSEAQPVILLHPGGGHALIWIHNIEPLSQFYRVYAVDIIGELNKSIPIRPIQNHQEFISWMIDLLDFLNIKNVNLVGNSNGGFFALESALYIPERINKVVLISPAATFVQMWAWWWHLLIPAHIIAPIFHAESMIQKAYAWLWQNFPIDDYYTELRKISKVTGSRYRPTINSFHPHVFKDKELQKIKNPVLLLIGDHEVIYDSTRVFQRASRFIADLKTKIVPNANHSAQYTAPDFVNSEILEFFK